MINSMHLEKGSDLEPESDRMKPSERASHREAEKLLNVTPRGTVIQDSSQIESYSLLKFFGESLSFGIFCFTVFTLFLLLKEHGIINWIYWWIFSPIGIFLLVLLILTQSRRLTKKATIILRLAWLICGLCLLGFFILLVMLLEHDMYKFVVKYIFVPLWILFILLFILGVIGIGVGCTSREEHRRKKYLLAGIPLLVFDAVVFPFIYLLETKLIHHQQFSWNIVFIPLWITDGILLCIAALLLLFTVGARQEATFTISQILTLIIVLPASIAFKVLLALYLDGSTLNLWIVSAPLFFMELMFFTCGLNIRFRDSCGVQRVELK